jgi:hypothetical protein
MAFGPGKYDEALTEARKLCGATSAVLIVLTGESGPGFSCQTTLPDLARLPAILRNTADQLEADLKKGQL